MYTPLGRIRETSAVSTTPSIDTYSRGFILPTTFTGLISQDFVAPLIHPVVPIAPIASKSDSYIQPYVRPPIMPTNIIPDTVYKPVGVRNAEISFLMVEAKKYHYTLAEWQGLGPTGRANVRRLFSQTDPVTNRDGTPIRETVPTVIVGPNDANRLNFADPPPLHRIVPTDTGLEFDERRTPLVRATQSAPSTQTDIMSLAIVAATGLFAYHFFFKTKPRRRRRMGPIQVKRYPRPVNTKRIRQGWQ